MKRGATQPLRFSPVPINRVIVVRPLRPLRRHRSAHRNVGSSRNLGGRPIGATLLSNAVSLNKCSDLAHDSAACAGHAHIGSERSTNPRSLLT